MRKLIAKVYGNCVGHRTCCMSFLDMEAIHKISACLDQPERTVF